MLPMHHDVCQALSDTKGRYAFCNQPAVLALNLAHLAAALELCLAPATAAHVGCSPPSPQPPHVRVMALYCTVRTRSIIVGARAAVLLESARFDWTRDRLPTTWHAVYPGRVSQVLERFEEQFVAAFLGRMRRKLGLAWPAPRILRFYCFRSYV